MIDICRFCQKEKFRMLDNFYRCVPCGMTSLYDKTMSNFLIEEIYVRIINGIEYHFKVDFAYKRCYLYTHPYYTNILSIDHEVVTTPDAIANKIKTYLLFL